MKTVGTEFVSQEDLGRRTAAEDAGTVNANPARGHVTRW
jgi:hypothetical protein